MDVHLLHFHCELGLAGKHRDEFIPRWIKRELQKQKPSCCVPGCDTVSDHTCMFASFNTICTAASVNVDRSSFCGRGKTKTLPWHIWHSVS